MRRPKLVENPTRQRVRLLIQTIALMSFGAIQSDLAILSIPQWNFSWGSVDYTFPYTFIVLFGRSLRSGSLALVFGPGGVVPLRGPPFCPESSCSPLSAPAVGGLPTVVNATSITKIERSEGHERFRP